MPKRKKPVAKTRGPKGEGSVFPDARRGGYRGKVPVGRYPNGKTKYTEVWAPTHAECVAAKRAVLPPGPDTTVAAWADRWLASADIRPSTFDDYRHTVENYVKPAIGHRRVRDLTAGDVEHAVRAWMAPGGGRQGLGANTARKNLGHLVTMLDAARRNGLGANVAADARPPRAKRVDIRPFPPDDLARIVAAAARTGDAPFALLASTGCRLGEALALDATDFDPAAGAVRVTKTYSRKHGVRPPKSANGVRTVRVPAPALPAVVAAAAGRTSGPLFPSPSGGRREHSSLQRRWKTFLATLPTEYRNLHQLRHSVAMTMVAQGVNVTEIAEYLGDTVQTIVRTYLHPKKGDPAAAVERALAGTRVP